MCQYVGGRVYITSGVLMVLGVPGWDGEQEVAIKWPRHGTAECRDDFLREATMLQRFRGPGVPPLLGCGLLPEFDDVFDIDEPHFDQGYALILPKANMGTGELIWSTRDDCLYLRDNGIESVVRSLRTLVRIIGFGPAAALSRVHQAGYMYTNITPRDFVFHRQANGEVVAWMGLGYSVGPVVTGGHAVVYRPVDPWAPRTTWFRDGVSWDWEDDVYSFGMCMLHIVCGVPSQYLVNLWEGGTWEFPSGGAACSQIPNLFQAQLEEIVQDFALARWKLNSEGLREIPMDQFAVDAQLRLVREITRFFLLCCLPIKKLPWGLDRSIRRPTAPYIHMFMSNFTGRVTRI